MQFTILWKGSGRKATQPPNPAYPEGIVVGTASILAPACAALPEYPAPECGVWVVECKTCGSKIAVTAAGRPDDPVKIYVPCKSAAKH